MDIIVRRCFVLGRLIICKELGESDEPAFMFEAFKDVFHPHVLKGFKHIDRAILLIAEILGRARSALALIPVW